MLLNYIFKIGMSEVLIKLLQLIEESLGKNKHKM